MDFIIYLLKFTEAIFDVVEHYTKTTRESWVLIMETDSAVFSQVEDVVNEIRWKLSVNAVKLFKVILVESFDGFNTLLNPLADSMNF
jgi:hypothetical protein